MVDASDDDVAEALADLHRLTFFDAEAMPDSIPGAWGLANFGDNRVVFADVVPSTYAWNSSYS